MKKIQRTLSLIGILFCITTAQAQSLTIDSAVYRLFSCLKAKDADAYLEIFPTGQQLTKMIRTLLDPQKAAIRTQLQKILEADEKTKNYNVDSLLEVEYYDQYNEGKMEKINTHLRTTFQQIITAGESKGVIWKNAKIKNYIIDSSFADKGEEMRQQLTNIKVFKGAINFTSAGNSYRVLFEQLVYLSDEGGWFGGEIKHFIRDDEKVENGGLPTLLAPTEIPKKSKAANTRKTATKKKPTS